MIHNNIYDIIITSMFLNLLFLFKLDFIIIIIINLFIKIDLKLNAEFYLIKFIFLFHQLIN